MIESKCNLIYTLNDNIKMIKKPLNRICPSCKKTIEYKSREACRKGERDNSICKSCAVKNDYIKNPNKNIGENNGRFGKDLKDLMISKYGIDLGNIKYNNWKLNLYSFKKGPENPQFGKPGHINSGMSYKGWYDYYDGEFIKNNLSLSGSSRLYPTIDHKVSTYFGFINNIEAVSISELSNLCITKRYINSMKGKIVEKDFTINN